MGQSFLLLISFRALFAERSVGFWLYEGSIFQFFIKQNYQKILTFKFSFFIFLLIYFRLSELISV